MQPAVYSSRVAPDTLLKKRPLNTESAQQSRRQHPCSDSHAPSGNRSLSMPAWHIPVAVVTKLLAGSQKPGRSVGKAHQIQQETFRP